MPSASLPSTSSELISHLQLLYPACSQCHWQRALCRKITETGDGYGWQSCPSPGLTHSPMPSSLTLLVCSCSQLGSPAPHTAVVGLSLPNWGVPWMCCWGHHVPVMLKVFWVSPLCPNWVWVCLCWRHSLGFSMGFLPAPGPSLCCQPSGWLGLAGWEVFRHDERSQDIIFCIFRYIFRPGTSNIYKPDSGVWNLQEHPWWGGVPNFNVLFPFSWGIFRWHQFHVMGVKQRPLDLTKRYFSAWQKFFNWKIWGFSDLFCFVFFNRKNDISSNMKTFLYPLFFFLVFWLENTSCILFWVMLVQTASSFPLIPSSHLQAGLLSQAVAHPPPKPSSIGITCILPLPNFLNAFFAGNSSWIFPDALARTLSWLSQGSCLGQNDPAHCLPPPGNLFFLVFFIFSP